MNVTRIVILGVAAIAAGAAALLVRTMIGGGTAPTLAIAPPPSVTVDVLVAAKDIQPGHALDVDGVRWEAWPKSAISDPLITKDEQPDINKAVEGAIVRSPLLSGQPVIETGIVRAGSAGFMAATIAPGMRGISMPVSAETGAGGFVLPNDRVDVILTRELATGSVKLAQSETILRDVRVLAIDQTLHQEKDAQSAVGKTATLELSPYQSELIAQAIGMGTLSLALRPLGEKPGNVAENRPRARTNAGLISVIRYGIAKGAGNPNEGTPPR